MSEDIFESFSEDRKDERWDEKGKKKRCGRREIVWSMERIHRWGNMSVNKQNEAAWIRVSYREDNEWTWQEGWLLIQGNRKLPVGPESIAGLQAKSCSLGAKAVKERERQRRQDEWKVRCQSHCLKIPLRICTAQVCIPTISPVTPGWPKKGISHLRIVPHSWFIEQ